MDKPTPLVLRNWSAKRAGSHITVHGTDVATGLAAKVTNVTEITPPRSNAAHEVIGVDQHGTEHRFIYP